MRLLKSLANMFMFSIPKVGTFVSVHCDMVAIPVESSRGMSLFNSCPPDSVKYQPDSYHYSYIVHHRAGGMIDDSYRMKANDIYLVTSNFEECFGDYTSHLCLMSREGKEIIVPDHCIVYIKEAI